jgi:anti-anti-sigma regulatory factor
VPAATPQRPPRTELRDPAPQPRPPRPRSPDRLTRVAPPRDDAPGVTELSLRQSALRDPDAPRLRAELVAHHQPGAPARIVLSFKGLAVLSAPCLCILTEVAESLARLGGCLILCEVPQDTARVLKRTGLARTLRPARSPEHARRLAQAKKPYLRPPKPKSPLHERPEPASMHARISHDARSGGFPGLVSERFV